MNINDNLNNQINPGRQTGRTQDTRSGDRVRSRARTDQVASQGQAETTSARQVEQSQDTVNLSTDSYQIEELTRAVEQIEQEPREELISQIQTRIAAGEYNSPAIIRTIAESLIDSTISNG